MSGQWHSPLNSEFGRQKQADLHEFEASLVYIIRDCLKKATKKPTNNKKKRVREYDDGQVEIKDKWLLQDSDQND